MSVVKLLSRIVAPKSIDRSKMTSAEKISSELHDHTYGITSDPLTQFAVVLSALIHDVGKLSFLHALNAGRDSSANFQLICLCSSSDHTGVPNAQLVKENAKVAAYYKGKSVAEQVRALPSVDVCLAVALSAPQFAMVLHRIRWIWPGICLWNLNSET